MDQYADQNYVFECIGREALDYALMFCNCCIFAYGQTGTGKSYTMIGEDNNPGILPNFCKELYQQIDMI